MKESHPHLEQKNLVNPILSMQIDLLVFIISNKEDENYAKRDDVQQNLPLIPDIELSIQSNSCRSNTMKT